MGTLSFRIPEKLVQSLSFRGGTSVSEFINSQMIVHGMDVSRPYKMAHDTMTHRYVVSQDTEEDTQIKKESDEDLEFQRRAGTSIHGHAADDLSV